MKIAIEIEGGETNFRLLIDGVERGVFEYFDQAMWEAVKVLVMVETLRGVKNGNL